MKLIAKTLLVAGFAASSMVAQDKKTDQKPAPKEATDVVCGMTVDTKSAEKTDYKGKTYYFCSVEDKNDFLKAPDKFVAKNDKKK
jgi:YHS domain-containing protein